MSYAIAAKLSFRVQNDISARSIYFSFHGKVQILAPVIVKEQYRQVIAQADKK